MASLNRKVCVVISSVLILVCSKSVRALENEDFWLYGDVNEICIWGFTHAGYSDYFVWGQSPRPRHSEYGWHEMLSGEHACAIAWENCGTNEVFWLTDWFEYPSFPTYSPFQSVSPYYLAWDDQNNPVDNIDTAFAVIQDTQNRIRITMDFEVVDLGEQDANGIGGSPISFKNAYGTVAYVNSERYVLLQTYSLKNVSASTINGLQVWQLLHGHPANVESGNFSSYTTENYYDPLSNYVPYNPVHQVGNFRYEISQWNQGDPNTQHVDWIGVSSTIPPAAYDISTFPHASPPTTGTYVHVMNRSLNNQTYIDNAEVAGAMQFNLGSLTPNETKKITIAILFGCGPVNYEPPVLPPDGEVTLTKTDDIGDGNCVNPSVAGSVNSYINYTISYSTTCDINDVNIIDYLSDYVTFNSCTGGGAYDPNLRAVRWKLDRLDANESGYLTLKVRVAENAPQGDTVTNTVKMYTGPYLIKTKTMYTQVCCLDSPIYVDGDANDGGDGLSWQTAFNDLQYAIDYAAGHQCYDTVYVASGTYQPVNDTGVSGWDNYSFELADGVALFGHFAGTENDPLQRQLSNPAYATILQGEIESGQSVDKVVRADGITGAVLDGFTVTGAYNYGIYLNNHANVAVANCIVTANNSEGIRLQTYATIDMHNCTITDNASYGVFLDYSSQADVTECLFDGNNTTGTGIHAQNTSILVGSDSDFTGHTRNALSINNSTMTLQGCDIDDSAVASSDNGIYLSAVTDTTISNCAIKNVNASSSYRGIIGSGSITVENTSITNWGLDGICFDGAGSLAVTDSVIADNWANGILNGGSGTDNIRVERCLIYGNANDSTRAGIYLTDSESATIINNWIFRNYRGLYCGTNSSVTIRNNTIAYNTTYGVSCSPTRTLNNCILWGNATEYSGCTPYYCCIRYGPTNNNNINSDPCFYDPNVNVDDYHLKGDSPCIDVGNPSLNYSDQTDIDGENRVIDIAGKGDGVKDVDMGGDEYYWPKADYDKNWIVNFLDYSIFAKEWLDVNSAISLDSDP